MPVELINGFLNAIRKQVTISTRGLGAFDDSTIVYPSLFWKLGKY